ncbi:MAG: tRNA (adenosine(37)-N6)-threonylcarbamoyltransferase complex dimerization subunit type 1 TsaB [Lachnospiraceae bacterium]|nr:tRNA (adenosine(37)-N6)-threonylcarbamoyltransferase complex dimerization subunit type 1 TsaB [Lachnospiraceae bacterium]
MRILGIESSSLVAGVAVVTDDVVTAEYNVNYKKTHSQTLLPMLDEIKKMTELNLNTIDAIAVSGGPGSFTGLRIGSATAKGLGLALEIPLIHIPTLEAMAYNFYGVQKYICPIMDARRNQVYTGLYHFEGEKIICDIQQCAISIDELVKKLENLNEEVIFTGDGIPVFKDYIDENMKNIHSFAPPHMSRQRAASVAALGKQYYLSGKTETAEAHVPDYLRLSQAERERKEKEEVHK